MFLPYFCTPFKKGVRRFGRLFSINLLLEDIMIWQLSWQSNTLLMYGPWVRVPARSQKSCFRNGTAFLFYNIKIRMAAQLVEHPDFKSGGPWVRVPARSQKSCFRNEMAFLLQLPQRRFNTYYSVIHFCSAGNVP